MDPLTVQIIHVTRLINYQCPTFLDMIIKIIYNIK